MNNIQLVVATRNRHKVLEIQKILDSRFRCVPLTDFSDPPEVEEDETTFSGNATHKSRKLALWLARSEQAQAVVLVGQSPVFVLADDSGLEVDVLDGAPGVRSARFSALDSRRTGNSPDAENNAKLLRLLREVPMARRTARFRCALALTVVPVWMAGPPGSKNDLEFSAGLLGSESFGMSTRGKNPAETGEMETRIFEGACEGHIVFEPRGEAGFGYDPLFVPVGYSLTFAELGEEVKNGISHRARALAALRNYLGQSVRRGGV